MLISISVLNLTCVTFPTTAQCTGIAMGGCMCKLCICPYVCLLVFLSLCWSVFMSISLSFQNLTCVTFPTMAQCTGIAMGGCMWKFSFCLTVCVSINKSFSLKSDLRHLSDYCTVYWNRNGMMYLKIIFLSICLSVYLSIFSKSGLHFLSVFISLSVFLLDQIWLDNVVGKSCLQKKCLTPNNQTIISFSTRSYFFPELRTSLIIFF